MNSTLNHATASPISVCKELIQLRVYNPAAVNIFLAVFILIQNIVVIFHYCKRQITFVSSMFMAIAVSDFLTAVAEITKSVAVIVVFNGHVDVTVLYLCMVVYVTVGMYAYNCSVIFYVTVGMYAYNCSVIFYAILTIMKTSAITANPLVRYTHTYNRTINVTISLTILCLLLSIGDVYLLTNKLSAHNTWEHICYLIQSETSVGNELLNYINIIVVILPDKVGNVIGNVVGVMLMVEHYVIPSVIVIVCMVIMMVFIKRTLVTRENNPYLDSANYINTTIVMISTLFFVCNTTFTFMVILDYIPGVVTGSDYRSLYTILGYAQYTLPLVHALFFPLILILRKRSLRDEFKDDILEILHLPMYIVRKIGSIITRCRRQQQGYETVE